MLTQTSEIAVKILIFLAVHQKGEPVSPRFLAERLGESPSYMAKITGMLVKAGILRGHRGISGGVTLIRDPQNVSLLDIVEACQGKILGDYCQEVSDMRKACNFHKAMHELHHSITTVLSHWTLEQLAKKPIPVGAVNGDGFCRMSGVCPIET